MAIRKVVGIETEYGIVLRGTPDANPIAASSMLINAYVSAFHRRVGWDFDDEHPGTDARGWLPDDAFPPEVETHLVNAVLTNGARYYVDHAHPEISTPECIDAREIVRFDRAAEVIVQRSMERAAATLTPGAELVAYKNNSDGKGNSYGCHENYLVDRAVPFGRLVAQITPHFVTRQIYCGSGKVGCELPGVGAGDVPFQISQRADFFEEEVGLETTLKRPIVNTRDEPHCDQTKYRRLHVIAGDANLSEISTFLKVGTTAMVLAMIEDGVAPDDLALAKPVLAIKDVSWDVTLQRLLPLKDGRKLRALDMQWQLFEKAEKWAATYNLKKKNLYNYENMEQIADNPDIDIIYVVTPPGLHPEFVVRAAKIGKHVISEKPMATSVPDCDRMIYRARKTGSSTALPIAARSGPGGPLKGQ
jgi:proteasome accessory factor A